MTLDKFLWYALTCGEYPYEDDISIEELPFKATKEDFANEDHYYQLCDIWWRSHDIQEIEDKIIDYDLEASWLLRRLVFKYDGKYYTFNYKQSIYWDDDYPVGKELLEVFPKEKVITVYEVLL